MPSLGRKQEVGVSMTDKIEQQEALALEMPGAAGYENQIGVGGRRI